MLLLSKEDIKNAFSMRDAIESNKQAFSLAVQGKFDMPLRTVIQQGKTDAQFIVMPAYSQDFEAAAFKVINIFPQNIDQGLNSCPAQVMLCDGNTGYITAIIDGDFLTKMRTGASSGVAFEYLAKKDCKKGALIGTGGQAPTQLEAMLTARQLEEVRVFDMNKDRCKAFCDRMQAELNHLGAKIVPADSSDDAIEDADLLITVTPSPKPVFDGTKIKAGCTISCVGVYTPDKHELDPAVLPRASKIICDYKDAALAETGDLIIPINEGIITEDDVLGSIGEVINGDIPGRESDDEIIVYETVGAAPQDLCAAVNICNKALERKVGTVWNE